MAAQLSGSWATGSWATRSWATRSWATAAPVLAAVVLAGCARAPAARQALSFWAMGREGEVVRELVPEFERRHPGIAVEVQQIPWTAAHEKLLTAYVGGTTPDVAQLGNTWIPELVALGALVPLDEWIARSPAIDRGDGFPGIWRTNVLDGATWGVPWYVDTRVLFYRRDLVAQARAPWPPRTWEEWRRGMEAVKALGPNRYAILLPIDEWEKPVLLSLQTGCELLRDGGRYGNFRDPRCRRAMAFYTDLYADRLAPALDATGVANLYQQFAEGYFAMYITGPWNLGEFRRRLAPEMQDRWATVPLPAPDGSFGYPGASLAGGSSLVVLRGCRSLAAAGAWIDYLSEPEQQAAFYRLSGNLPARRAAWAMAGLQDDPRAAAFLAQLERAVPTPQVPEWEQIAARVADRAEAVMRRARGLDAALADLDADIDRILEKRRFLLARAAGKGR